MAKLVNAKLQTDKYLAKFNYPLMAELVDAPVLGTGSERSVGSSPTVGTIRCIQQCILT